MGLDGGTIISRNDVLRGSCWDLNKADNSRSSRGGSVSGIYKRRKLDTRTSRWVKPSHWGCRVWLMCVTSAWSASGVPGEVSA